jgi:hypothetical protein
MIVLAVSLKLDHLNREVIAVYLIKCKKGISLGIDNLILLLG